MVAKIFLIFLILIAADSCHGKNRLDRIVKQKIKINRLLNEGCTNLEDNGAKEEYRLREYTLVLPNVTTELVIVRIKDLFLSVSSESGMDVVRMLPSVAKVESAYYARNPTTNVLEVYVPYYRTNRVLDLKCEENVDEVKEILVTQLPWTKNIAKQSSVGDAVLSQERNSPWSDEEEIISRSESESAEDDQLKTIEEVV